MPLFEQNPNTTWGTSNNNPNNRSYQSIKNNNSSHHSNSRPPSYLLNQSTSSVENNNSILFEGRRRSAGIPIDKNYQKSNQPLLSSGNVKLVLDTSFDRLTKRPPAQVLVPTTTNEDATYLETTSAVSGLLTKNGQDSTKNGGTSTKKEVMRRLYYQKTKHP